LRSRNDTAPRAAYTRFVDAAVLEPSALVLVADDNAAIRDFLVARLRLHFSLCEPVADGRRLVEAALVRKPDVIVSDINMPVLDGLGAMRALRRCGQNTPFVMVSADQHYARECMARGAAAFVSKLDIGSDLIQAVFAALAGRTYLSASAEGLRP
jgi:CheY-like chemotaxis protein